jgi:serine/threonine-protein kinase
VRLSITSTPPGAEVYAADVLLGTTPLTLQRPVDTVAELRFELSGYENVSRKVGFSADHTLNIALEALKRAAPPPPLPPRVTPPPARAKAQDLKEAPF